MKTDAFGFTHPEPSDVPSLIGALHICECGPCQQAFGPDIVGYCQQLGEAYEQQERDRAVVRKHA
jgi:hypothetical protein